jgi:hypothetical protein
MPEGLRHGVWHKAERGCTDGHAGAARPTVRAAGMQGCRTGASWRQVALLALGDVGVDVERQYR